MQPSQNDIVTRRIPKWHESRTSIFSGYSKQAPFCLFSVNHRPVAAPKTYITIDEHKEGGALQP
jgi:hypothetical protein